VRERPVLLRRAALAPRRLADVRLAGGRVTAVTGRLEAEPGAEEIDLDGRVALPGLSDHHIHLLALGAALGSVDVSGVRTLDDLVGRLRTASPPREGGWVRAVGLDTDLAPLVDRWVLDRSCTDPLRVQDRTGSWWILNSAAVRIVLPGGGPWPPGVLLDPVGRPTGRLVRLDGWLRDRTGDRLDPAGALAAAGSQLARRGITAVTDASAGNGVTQVGVLASAVRSGVLPQRVTVMTGDPEVAVPEPLETGPVKILLDDAALPDLDGLAERVRAAHARGRPVAVHCVTAVQLALTLAALQDAGSRPGDRIEHAAIVTDDLLAPLARSRAVVVTQPGFVFARGDRYLDQVEGAERDALYRLAGLRRAGVGVAGSSDAPFGPADPWVGIRAAVDRRTRGGDTVGPDEAMTIEAAVGMWTGGSATPAVPRRISTGMAADLCILDATWSELTTAEPLPVSATLIGGIPVTR